MPPSEPFRLPARIRFVDTDASGRIHFTAMFRHFEVAEAEFLRTLGLTHDPHYGFPRVHVECDYLLPLVYDDPIEIEVSLSRLGTSSMTFEFRTLKAGSLAAKGLVVAVCMDRNMQRATAIPDYMRRRLAETLIESHQRPTEGN